MCCYTPYRGTLQKFIPLPPRDPLAQFDVEKREHEMKMKKMEQEMEEVFEMKVQEKLQKLKDIEADVSSGRGGRGEGRG